MRQHDWLSSQPSTLPSVSDTLSSSCPTFNPVLISVSAILKELVLETKSVSAQASYRDVASFFRQHPLAIGVLVVSAGSLARNSVGLISRRRFLRWRSQRRVWKQALDQPIASVQDWWQEALEYLAIEDQMPLEDAISLVLGRSGLQAEEPLVVSSATDRGLIDLSQFLAAYARLARSEQSAIANRDLEKLRRQHQLILNAIGEGVYGVDLQGNATFVNPAAAKMIGWEIADLIGKSMHDVLHHSHPDGVHYPKEQCPIYAAFQDGIVHRVTDEVFWRQDGTCFPVEYISTPMRDEQGCLVGAVVTFRDITQRKWAEAILHRANEELDLKVRERTAELRQVNEQLKELSELRSRVVSMVCHEFRNPLNNILLSVSSLERYETHLTSAQKENYLTGIQADVERMTQMIDDILVIGKVDARRIEVQPSLLELVEFCQTLVAEVQVGSGSNRIEFRCRAKALQAEVDEKLLRSILTNILINSLHYSPASSQVHFKLSRQKQQLVFQIQDQGIGIPPEDQPYLFEPFHRGKNVSNIPGTGLGLNIVKRFVDLQQGHITVNSKLGAGTTFVVTLPLQIP